MYIDEMDTNTKKEVLKQQISEADDLLLEEMLMDLGYEFSDEYLDAHNFSINYDEQ